MYKIFFIAKEAESGKILGLDDITVEYRPSTEDAIKECKEVVDYFNSTLRPGEKKREFDKVEKIELYIPPIVADDDDDDLDNDF